jgi:Protein of unknown function, DUF481
MKSIITAILVIASLQTIKAQSSPSEKLNVRYQINLNGTLDKNLVQRVILFSQNRITIASRTNKLEPMLNYKFGHVTPNGKPRLNLENDITALVENQFIHQYKIFPAAVAGFETSPYLRKLNTRWFAGAGAGTYLVKTKSNFAQLNLYSYYEQNNYATFNLNTARIMPSIKGRHSFENDKYGFIYNLSYATSLNNAQNYRIRTFVKPYLRINKKLDFNILYDLGYENISEINQPKEISVLTFGFTYANN